MKKSLYVFLCMLLGALMFAVLHQAVTLIYYMLLNLNFGAFSLNLNAAQVQTVQIYTFGFAVLLGGWYGTWLGLHWYDIVYEKEHGGIFYGFRGKLFRQHEPKPITAAPAVIRPAPKKTTRSLMDMQPSSGWDMDDLINGGKPEVPPAPMAVTEPPAVIASSTLVVEKTVTDVPLEDADALKKNPNKIARTRSKTTPTTKIARRKTTVKQLPKSEDMINEPQQPL